MAQLKNIVFALCLLLQFDILGQERIFQNISEITHDTVTYFEHDSFFIAKRNYFSIQEVYLQIDPNRETWADRDTFSVKNDGQKIIYFQDGEKDVLYIDTIGKSFQLSGRTRVLLHFFYTFASTTTYKGVKEVEMEKNSKCHVFEQKAEFNSEHGKIKRHYLLFVDSDTLLPIGKMSLDDEKGAVNTLFAPADFRQIK